MYPVFEGIGLDLIRYQVEQHPFKADLIAPLGRSVDDLWDTLWASQRILDAGPHTLLHGDTHIGNTYVLPDGTGGFLDWQLMVRGSYANDVAYVIATGLDPATRRAEQRALIEFYLEQLRRRGVDAPSFEEAWTGYRLAIIWGIVIGWLITPPVNYGEAITSANISRLVDAALDVDSLGALRD
jgi:aminoglycoside phosphotransferase (APT) family kinase protein